jgi:formylmethanofuran dehydrogenase subunit B
VLVLGAAARIPNDVLAAIALVPCAVLGPRATESALAFGVAAIDSGVAGIHEGGTALRMDDVPLPLRPSMDGPPGAAALIRQLRERVARAAPRTATKPVPVT